MRILVTGSAGFIGQRVCQRLARKSWEVIGFDQRKPKPQSEYKNIVDIVGRVQYGDELRNAFKAVAGVDVVVHAAGYHRPYLDNAIISVPEMIETNVVGTLNVLEAAVDHNVKNVVFTSTTAVYGHARAPMRSPDGAQMATIIDEDTQPMPSGVYGMSKLAAERLCTVYNKRLELNVVILRPSRFFPDLDLDDESEEASHNRKANEFLHRRVDIRDLVEAYCKAVNCVEKLGFGLFIISAQTPLSNSHAKTPLPKCDLQTLITNAPHEVRKFFPEYEGAYESRGWEMPRRIEFVYDSCEAAKSTGLDWKPRYDFGEHLQSGFGELKPCNELVPWRQILQERQQQGGTTYRATNE